MIKQMGKTDEDFDDGKMMVRYFKNVIENHDVDIEKDGTWAKAWVSVFLYLCTPV